MSEDDPLAYLRYLNNIRDRYNAIPLAVRERIKGELRAANNYNDPTGYNRPTMAEIVAAYEGT